MVMIYRDTALIYLLSLMAIILTTLKKMNKQLLLITLLYLSTHNANSQTNIDTTSFNTVMEQVNFGNPNFVVIGEHHYINNTFATESFIIEKLAEQGYKNIYMEGGHSEAAIMNIYLQTGDTSLLKNTRARVETYRQSLEYIYQTNRKNNYGLTYSGFDFERPLCVGYLFSKWFDNANTISLKKVGEYLGLLDALPPITLAEVEQRGFKMKTILDSLKSTFNETYYKEILKDNYNLFHKIVYNPVYADFKKSGLFEKRDPYFIKTMLEEEKQGRLDKSIIITGGSHMIDEGRFIGVLADSLVGKYSITAFFFVYNNCIDYDSNKPYTSPKSHLKYLNKNLYKNPQINFTQIKYWIIPTRNDEVINIVVGMHNQ